MDARTITLANLADGTAEELWAAALGKVLENIDDPNTDAEAKRRISLTFTFATNAERRNCKVEVTCSTKLAGIQAAETLIFIGRHEGKLAAVEALKQEDMFTSPAGRPRAIEGANQA